MADSFPFKYVKPLHFNPCRESDIAGILLEVNETLASATKANEIQEAVQKIVRCPWSNQLLDISEQLFMTLQSWQRNFLEDNTSVAFPLNSELHESLMAFLTAWQKLGAAYYHWIEIEQQSPRKSRAFLMLRLFETLRQILLLHYFFHWQLPENLWRDIHSVYRLAVDKDVVSLKTKLPGLHHGKRTTLEKRYKQNLLLGLAGPFGLMPEELKLLEPLMEKWAPLLVLEMAAGTGWRIDHEKDVPAVWTAEDVGLRINFAGLLKLLKEHREFASKAGRFEYWQQDVKDTLSLDLLEHLVQSWLSGTQEEVKPPERCHLIAGFKPLFNYLIQEENPTMWMAMGQAGWLECQVALGGVQVGDLLGIVRDGSLDDLAVVAQLKQTETGLDSVLLKLRPLLQGVEPVGIQPLLSVQKLQVYQRGLLGRAGGKEVLLLQQQPLEPGTVVRMLKDEAVYPLKLEEKQNPARGVLQFSCQSATNNKG